MTERTLEEKLVEALDGPYRQVRDDAHTNPDTVLVFEEATECVEAVELSELAFRYPTNGPGARWSYVDLGKLVASKALLYRWSKAAHEVHEENPTSQPSCGVPVLAVPVRPGPYRRLEVKARVCPEQ